MGRQAEAVLQEGADEGLFFFEVGFLGAGGLGINVEAVASEPAGSALDLVVPQAVSQADQFADGNVGRRRRPPGALSRLESVAPQRLGLMEATSHT
jgi:hypothetical protein